MPAMTFDGIDCDLVVVLHHAVVVELPRVRDAVLGGGELLLQRQEVLVRLQVGVRLGEREQRLQRAGEHVLGLRLLLGPALLRLDRGVARRDDTFEGRFSWAA